jgi:hypothetical protein
MTSIIDETKGMKSNDHVAMLNWSEACKEGKKNIRTALKTRPSIPSKAYANHHLESLLSIFFGSFDSA